MKITAVIQARMGSTRLRAKSLMPIAGKPLLSRVLNNIQRMDFIDEIIVATTDLAADDPLVACVEKMGVNVFRGSALNVLDRFYSATSLADENDVIMRITADNPFINENATKRLLDDHIANNYDYSHVENLSHIVAEFIRTGALREIVQNHGGDNFDKEHVTPFFRRHHMLFNVQTVPSNFQGLRPDLDKFLTVDTMEQLELAEKIIIETELDKRGMDISRIYAWLDQEIVPSRGGDTNLSQLNLNGSIVGGKSPTYIIAEIGQNHNGEITNAQKLIDMAVRCNADAVKFQKRDILSELTTEAFNRPYDNPNSFGETYGQHREFLEFDEEQHLFLKEYAESQGITYICTPCDIPSVEMLERINCSVYKVASRDLTNLPLIRRLSKTGKPVILSTGMATIQDIDDALLELETVRNNVGLLQCTSEYPCAIENVNLNAMLTLKNRYKCVTGFSDHTSGIIVSVAASVMGASIIEKHVTLNRGMKGTDQAGSLEERGLFKLVEYIRTSEQAMGSTEKEFVESTSLAKIKLARSLTTSLPLVAGTIIQEEFLELRSPGDGISWRDRDKILGHRLKVDYPSNTTIRQEDVD